jgi:hypothetical protein
MTEKQRGGLLLFIVGMTVLIIGMLMNSKFDWIIMSISYLITMPGIILFMYEKEKK